jgi:membrane protease YdiL (CAAX protease family)
MGLPEACNAAASHGLPEVRVFWPSLVGAIPMLCCLGYLTRQAGTTVDKVFGLRGARVGLVLVSCLLLFILEMLLMAGAVILLTRLGFEKGPTRAEETAKIMASSFFVLTDATVWAPLCEELWFRALLYTSLRTRFGVAPSAVVTATLFASIHGPQSLVSAGVFFFPAVLSSLWYERTRSLWPNVIAHSLINTLPIIVVHAGG